MVVGVVLNIKDPEADRLARELAAATGESITVAARRALSERLERVRAKSIATDAEQSLRDIIERGRSRQVLDDRDADAIVGYDLNGLPG